MQSDNLKYPSLRAFNTIFRTKLSERERGREKGKEREREREREQIMKRYILSTAIAYLCQIDEKHCLNSDQRGIMSII